MIRKCLIKFMPKLKKVGEIKSMEVFYEKTNYFYGVDKG